MRALIGILPLVLCLATLACGPLAAFDAVPKQHLEEEIQRFEYKQVHMGVQARIILYAPDSSTAHRAAAAAFDRIAALDAIMSDYRSDSELMRLAARGKGRWTRVSEDLYHVLVVADGLSRRSDGAFDITIGPIVALWRKARRSGNLPADSALAVARSKSGWRLVELDSANQSVRLDADGMRLDLGGIAKGYAADEALAVLRDYGVTRALIEFGGDIAAGDPPPKSDGWRVLIPLLDAADQEVTITNGAVSVSGDTQQFVEIDGSRYSHVVDPRTGRGLTGGIAVTVIADRAMLTDALATTLSVMGPDAGKALLDAYYPTVRAYFRLPPE